METNSPFQPTPVETDDGKAAAIVSYFSIIGWLIAYFALYKDHKTSLSSYQLKQTLLFHIITLVFGILVNMIFFTLLSLSLATLVNIVYLGLFVLWIIGFIGALNGQKKPIPLIGEKAQTMFPSI